MLDLTDAEFAQLVNAAFKNHQSLLALSRSDLAHTDLLGPTLVLDDVSPTADERGRALRLVLRWAVSRLAPGPAVYPIGAERPFDDPTWRAPLWWRYNILRHRYVQPIHPDDFVEGGRFTETLLNLTGIPGADAFYEERNRAIQDVAEQLRRQLMTGEADDELRRLALESALQALVGREPLQTMLGIGSTFPSVFPYRLLMRMAEQEGLQDGESLLVELTQRRLLLLGDGGTALSLSPALRQHVYHQQAEEIRRRRHRRAAGYFQAHEDHLAASFHYLQAGDQQQAAQMILHAAPTLIKEMELGELMAQLPLFRPQQLTADQWRDVQLLFSDLSARMGQQEESLAACRRALQVTQRPSQQARIYRRMGKLYEEQNRLHALGYYQQAVERFEPSDPELLDLLKDRAWLYIFAQEWEKAEADLRFALAQASPEDKRQRADIFDALAGLYRRKNEYEVAIRYARDALILREEIGDVLRVAHSFGNLGLLYTALGEFAQAIAAYEEAMNTFRPLGNRRLMATALLNLGMAHQLDGRPQEATGAYQECLENCQAIGLPLIETKAHSNLVEVLAEQGLFAQAQAHWTAGFALSQSSGFDDQVSYYRTLLEQYPDLAAQFEADLAGNERETRGPIAPDGLNAQEDEVIRLLQGLPRITAKGLMEAADMSKATATRRLTALVEKGVLIKTGRGRGTYYRFAGDDDTPTAPQSFGSGTDAARVFQQLQGRLQQQQGSLQQQFGVENLSLQTLTEDDRPQVRVVARFARLPHLLEFVELQDQLNQLFGRTVDLRLEEDPPPLAAEEQDPIW